MEVVVPIVGQIIGLLLLSRAEGFGVDCDDKEERREHESSHVWLGISTQD